MGRVTRLRTGQVCERADLIQRPNLGMTARIAAMTGRTVDFAIARVDVDDPMQTSTLCSLVGVPPAEKFRRQIEAG